MTDPLTILVAALHDAPPGPILVGLSGGMDSTALLCALASLEEARERGLRAIHVDHGLHPASTEWSTLCAKLAATLAVPLRVIKVSVVDRKTLGPEAAARQARRSAFRAELNDGELLALAHHRDDQAETFLLRLLRGAGPDGLAAMRALRRFAAGWVWRPWLNVGRAELRALVAAHGLTWIEDPSNADTKLDRNFLRQEILPRLTERWPGVTTSIARSATWCAAAARSLDNEASVALAELRGPDRNTLKLAPWSVLPETLRGLVLRLWLRDLDLPEPQHARLVEIMRQLIAAGGDRRPAARWPGAELRRYGALIYALASLPAPPGLWNADWDGSAALVLPEGCGRLLLAPIKDQAFEARSPALQVRFRHGGERLRPNGQAHTRELKHLFQDAAIPPWQRARVPLIFQGDELQAVGDLWMTQEFADLLAARGLGLRWERDSE